MAPRDQIDAVEHLATGRTWTDSGDHDEDIINYPEREEKVYLMLFSVSGGRSSRRRSSSSMPPRSSWRSSSFSTTPGMPLPGNSILPNGVSLPVADSSPSSGEPSPGHHPAEGGEDGSSWTSYRRTWSRPSSARSSGSRPSERRSISLHLLPQSECFDISHLSGTSTVGSMVRFVNGRPEKRGTVVSGSGPWAGSMIPRPSPKLSAAGTAGSCSKGPRSPSC